MVYHAVTKACISNGFLASTVNAVSCCKSCKGYGEGYFLAGCHIRGNKLPVITFECITYIKVRMSLSS